ncbi:MAG: sulfur carrier protein ThiS [Endomicrobium sp.]|jgi:sulfur carrier protein|nr:sulfur carrier protein ThiS [Endomicrobium sp.]
MITVKVNGQNKEMRDNITISDFLNDNSIDLIGVTVEHNFKIINPNNFTEITLQDQDTLEILRFVGGG